MNLRGQIVGRLPEDGAGISLETPAGIIALADDAGTAEANIIVGNDDRAGVIFVEIKCPQQPSEPVGFGRELKLLAELFVVFVLEDRRETKTGGIEVRSGNVFRAAIGRDRLGCDAAESICNLAADTPDRAPVERIGFVCDIARIACGDAAELNAERCDCLAAGSLARGSEIMIAVRVVIFSMIVGDQSDGEIVGG